MSLSIWVSCVYNKTIFALQPDPPQSQCNTLNFSMECIQGAQFVVQLELDYTLNDLNQDWDMYYTQISP